MIYDVIFQYRESWFSPKYMQSQNLCKYDLVSIINKKLETQQLLLNSIQYYIKIVNCIMIKWILFEKIQEVISLHPLQHFQHFLLIAYIIKGHIHRSEVRKCSADVSCSHHRTGRPNVSHNVQCSSTAHFF